VGPGQSTGGPATLELLFCFMKISFAESNIPLPAHVQREDLTWLSAKSSLPAQRCRECCAESSLSAHSLCREELGLCREQHVLDKAIEFGSEGSRTAG
jgi:hypothetical protein